MVGVLLHLFSAKHYFLELQNWLENIEPLACSFLRLSFYFCLQHTFSNGKGDTMVAKSGARIGKQSKVLSQEDILQASLLYNCPGTFIDKDLWASVIFVLRSSNAAIFVSLLDA